MDHKTDWQTTDFVNISDVNRIRNNFGLLLAGALPSPVDESYIFSADDILTFRSQYEQIAEAVGMLSNGPATSVDYNEFDPDVWVDPVVFPRLIWRSTYLGDHRFPAAWELNLYECLCRRVDQYAPRQGTVYIGGALTITETISIST